MYYEINVFIIFAGIKNYKYSSCRSATMPRNTSDNTGIHFTKNGGLDMRYLSSKATIAPNFSTIAFGSGIFPSAAAAAASSSFSAPAAAAAKNSLHFKKDGALDLRYSFCKEAANSSGYSSGCSSTPSPAAPAIPIPPVVEKSAPKKSNKLHYKKDGTLDMRYGTTYQAINLCTNSELHLRKDGTLDMRYYSSKQASKLDTDFNKMSVLCISVPKKFKNRDIPENVPYKSDGTPNMRNAEARQWVAEQAIQQSTNRSIPEWVPKKKDGSVNLKTAVGRAYAGKTSAAEQPAREDPPNKRQKVHEFSYQSDNDRMDDLYLPFRPSIIKKPLTAECISQYTLVIPNSNSLSMTALDYHDSANIINRGNLSFGNNDENHAVLGGDLLELK